MVEASTVSAVIRDRASAPSTEGRFMPTGPTRFFFLCVDERTDWCDSPSAGRVPKWPKGTDCKSVIRGFDSHRDLSKRPASAGRCRSGSSFRVVVQGRRSGSSFRIVVQDRRSVLPRVSGTAVDAAGSSAEWRAWPALPEPRVPKEPQRARSTVVSARESVAPTGCCDSASNRILAAWAP